MKIKVKVTQDDIANGIREDVCKCPIALALSRLAKGVIVDGNCADFWMDDSTQHIIELPLNVTQFIDNFDEGFIVKPFEFELTV